MVRRADHGRAFFEELIRENLDLGRPEQVQLIFTRQMQRQTVAAGHCRTRVLEVEHLSHDAQIGAVAFAKFQKTLDTYTDEKIAA